MSENKEEKTWDFDGRAARYDKIVPGDHPLYARYEEVLDAVVEKAEVSSGKRVLDIGTGAGNLVERCLLRGASGVGLDPSEGMLGEAREKFRGHTNVEFRKVPAPFLTIPYPDVSFDAVMSTYAFHHVPAGAKAEAIAEMFRVLRSGGSWALGDLAFENADSEKAALRRCKWLEEEYFARVEELRPVFAGLGVELHAQQFTPVTWVLWARKGVTHAKGK